MTLYRVVTFFYIFFMKIALATLAPPKVRAIEESLSECPYFEGLDVEVIPYSVPSGVSDMPLSLEENMLWAKNRAHNLREMVEADWYIGMEWGTTKIGEKAYLFWVVYILSLKGEGHYGISNMMEVPEVFQKRLYEHGEDLGNVLQELTWVENASKKNGAFWAWSDNLLTRKDQFRLAFFSAVPAFFNKYYKMGGKD